MIARLKERKFAHLIFSPRYPFSIEEKCTKACANIFENFRICVVKKWRKFKEIFLSIERKKINDNNG